MQVLHKFLLLHVLAYFGRNALGGKIINGVKVPEDSMLYMASLQTTGGHECGGFLISDNFVLTAAHCDVNDGLVRVVLGTHDLRKNGTVRTIEQRCKHPDYRNFLEGNDIMLLKLQSVPVGGTIQRIGLPPPDMDLQPNQLCFVAGWGRTQSGRGVDDLRVTLVSNVDHNVCRREWSNVKENLPANVICAGGYQTHNGVCFGDSGGPLVCNGTAAGIVSFVDRLCRDQHLPNVYTDVSKFRPWIDQILKENGC